MVWPDGRCGAPADRERLMGFAPALRWCGKARKSAGGSQRVVAGPAPRPPRFGRASSSVGWESASAACQRSQPPQPAHEPEFPQAQRQAVEAWRFAGPGQIGCPYSWGWWLASGPQPKGRGLRGQHCRPTLLRLVRYAFAGVGVLIHDFSVISTTPVATFRPRGQARRPDLYGPSAHHLYLGNGQMLEGIRKRRQSAAEPGVRRNDAVRD